MAWYCDLKAGVFEMTHESSPVIKGIEAYTSVVHPRIASWIRYEKLLFDGEVHAYGPDDLDPILFKVWGLTYCQGKTDEEHKAAGDPWEKWAVFDLDWLTSPHALTLFKAKCAQAGVNDFDQK